MPALLRRRDTSQPGRITSYLLSITTVLIILFPVIVGVQPLPSSWAVSDVGAPVIPGYATQTAGLEIVSGAGAGLGPSADQFTFRYRRLDGDGTIVARVARVQATTPSAKAGVMVRSSLAAGAAQAAAWVSAAEGLAFQRRRVDAGPTRTTRAAGAAGVWLKLQRRASRVTASWSSDGVTWRELGSDLVPLAGAVYVGLAVTSESEVAATQAAFSDVQVIESPTAGTRDPARASMSDEAPLVEAAAVGPEWTAQDIGNPSIAGTSTFDTGTYTVTAASIDIWDASDQFHYLHQPVSGDVDIVARVTALGQTHDWSKAGVMVRGALTAGAAHVSMLASGRRGMAAISRNSPGQLSVRTSGSASAAPRWVKLSVRGSSVTPFESGDGVTWTVVGPSIALPLPGTFYVGLAVSSHDPAVSVTATFDNVAVHPPPANEPPSVVLTAPVNGATYAAPATVTVSAAASDSDGSVTRVDFYESATLIGSDTTSPYSVSWSNVPAGSYSLSAVATDSGGATATSGAHAVTVTAAANQPPSVALTAPADGAAYTAPATVTVSATASDADGSITRVDFFQGATLIGSATTSPYSVTWSTVPAGSYSLTAVAVDNAGASVTSAARAITVSAPAGLPAGWTAADVNTPSRAGSTTYANGAFTVTAGGLDIWNGTDQFHYAYQQVSGDIDVVARVTAMGQTHDWSKGGVMIRASLAADAAHASMLATGRMGMAFIYRLGTGGASLRTSGTASSAPRWVKLSLRGNAVTGYESPDGTTWTAVGTQTLPLSVSFYVGLAVSSHEDAATVTATFDNVLVQAVTNQPPTVSLTAPANGAAFTAPATVTVSATASDADGSVTRVDFYEGATLIGSATTSPYSITWSNVPAGSYSLSAVATDGAGATATSGAHAVTVTAAANQPPSVALTAPTDGTAYTAPATVTVSATASDADGSITRVDFFQGATLIGSATSSPYSVTWSTVPAGSYSLTAVAVDNAGASVTSAARAITVSAPAGLPAGWTAADVNTPSRAGSTTYANGAFTVTAGGLDIWNGTDQFHYAYQQVSGDIDVVARVTAMGQTHDWSKGGVMIRASLAADAAHASMLATGRMGMALLYRPAAGQLTARTSGTASPAPRWVKLSLRGSAVTGYESADGTTWTAVGTQTLPLSATFYVGLAVSSHEDAATVTAAFDNVVVQPPSANQPPSVALTAPANGATYTAPATVTVSATASDADGNIARVDFYQGASLIGSDTTSPYSMTWSNVPSGSYALTAVATDSAGATTTSPARTITVTTSSSSPQYAVFSPSPDHDTRVTSYRFDVFAMNADPATATPIASQDVGKPPVANGEVTADVTTTITSLGPGTYQAVIAAVGAGGSTQSGPATFTNGASSQQFAVFRASPDHDTTVTSYRFSVYENGANPSTAMPLASQDVGKPPVVNAEVTAEITATLSALQPGTYQAAIAAVGAGGITHSAPATFTR